jgi:uncharacterized membrane protein YphA (DoxX/SURF4 family)
MKYIRNFARLLLGFVFIFSGFVKVVDPLGTTYKFIDYFNAMHLEFLAGIALPLSILMCAAELVLGIMLLFNFLPKLTSWGVLIFMIIFTPITFWLAVWNPVHDCGCFGDALILSNWATFWKNVVLLVFSILVFWQRKNYKSDFNLFTQWAFTAFFVFIVFAISFYCLRHLPIVDFRPYKIGKNISEGMVIPEEEKDNVDEYESMFIYEKDGEQKEFTLENLPDSTWVFVDAKHKLVKEGYQPPIHDFSINLVQEVSTPIQEDEKLIDVYDVVFVYQYQGENMDFLVDELPGSEWEFVGIRTDQKDVNPANIELYYQTESGDQEMFNVYNIPDLSHEFLYAEYYFPEMQSENDQWSSEPDDLTDMVLNDPGYTFILVSVFVEKANTEYQEQINEIAAFCEQKGYRFICLTASTQDPIAKFSEKFFPMYDFYNTDPITLKTIVRSNPGLVLLQEGTVLNKWAFRDLPDVSELDKNLTAYSVSKLAERADKRLVWVFILSTLLFFYLIRMFYMWLKSNKYIS